MAIKTHKVTLSLDNPRVIQSGINVQSFDKQSIQISIELTKNDEVFQVPSDATIRVSLLKLARQEQKIIVDVPNTNRESIDWIVPDYLDGYQGTVRVGVYLVSGAENVDLGYFTILSNVSDIDKMADEFTDNVFQGWEQIEADLNELNLTIAQTKLDLAEDLTQIDNTIANINTKNTQVNTLASDFTADVATKQSDVTSKYNAFDADITEANQTIDDILALQPQFQAVLDETTGKDVISAPEIILARGGAQTLRERLDSDKAEVTAQLAQTDTEVETVTKNPNIYNGAVFTIIDDDIRTDVRDVWLPVLQDTGAKITFAAITDWVGTTNYMTLQEVKDLQADGHEIVSHTATHIETNSAITPEQAEIEYPKAKQWLIDNGFTGYDTLVYPGGMNSERLEIKEVARKYYKYGVATILTGQPNVPPVDNWRVPRINGDSDSLDSLKAKVDKAIQDKSWALLMTHSHILGANGAQKMRDLITYVQSKGVPIMTFGEAVKYKGNVVAIGEYTDPKSTFIGADGNIKTKSNFLTPTGQGSVMDKPITEYQKNTVTKMSINKPTDTNFNTGGVHEVFRGDGDLYSYATFTPWNSNKIYMRKWDLTNDTWHPFELLASYDTGTWTPTLEGTTTAGTHTYSSQIGRYSRNGNIITASFYIRINFADLDSNMSGNIRIGGLPFAIINGFDKTVFQVEYNNLTLGTNYFNVIGEPSGDKLDFYKQGSGVPTVNLPTSALTDGQVVQFRGQATYRIA